LRIAGQPQAPSMPDSRELHTAVWTGTEMIVWGGDVNFDTGGRYNPSTDSWIATSTTNAPTARADHIAVWTGTEMIVWGEAFFFKQGFRATNTGARYCAEAGPTPTPTPTPTASASPTATLTPTPRPTPTARSRTTPAPRP
jgi:hypothetical protein